MGLTSLKADEFIFAIGEALANAAEHGHRDDGYVTMRIRSMPPAAVVVDVEDDGPGFDVQRLARGDIDETRGFGMRIMKAMADRVEFSPDGRRARLWKLQPALPPPTRRIHRPRAIADSEDRSLTIR